MIKDLWLIGIGAGSPSHVTQEGMQALRDAQVILMPDKGDEKSDLQRVRQDIISASGSAARIVSFDYPSRDPALPYLERVSAWHDEIARRWQSAFPAPVEGPVALLVWGDPSLYDSTLRIAERLSPPPKIRVVAGITALQALTAAHAIPFNTIGGAVLVTTGRNLRDHGWPEDVERVAVMLDGQADFTHLPAEGVYVWWGAYLGMEQQLLLSGKLSEIAEDIRALRKDARTTHGWIMDCCLLQRDV